MSQHIRPFSACRPTSRVATPQIHLPQANRSSPCICASVTCRLFRIFEQRQKSTNGTFDIAIQMCLIQSSPISWAIIRTGEGPPNEVQLRPGQGHRSLDRVNRSQWSVTQRGRVIRALPAPEIWAEGLEARAHRLSGESPRGLLAAASSQPLRTTAPAQTGCETPQ